MSICNMEDDILVEKLRKENYDQFTTLVRMHLSFVLDLNTDECDNLTDKNKLKRWTTPFGKKSKCRSTEGTVLTQESITQVYQLIEFLTKEQNICVEGIFRRTGSLNRQQELKTLLNQGMVLNLEDGLYSVHDCASVLKGFLAELPEPLLTDAHYPAYCHIAELWKSNENFDQDTHLLCSLQLLLLLLPPYNKSLLKDLLELLKLTASYEAKNKMSTDSLATLYTPHLLCPRKLSPEVLHTNSQTLSRILSYMIKKSSDLYIIPSKLAFDVRAYFAEREKYALSPQKKCDESVSDNFAARTVFTFIDLERTTRENQSNPTETALAQLYAHIQSMPESSKKRKLVKQFNKENGHGMPLQVMRSAPPKNKSISDSIKKRILSGSKSKSLRKMGMSQLRHSSEELLNTTPQQHTTKRSGLFCTSCDSTNSEVSISEIVSKRRKTRIRRKKLRFCNKSSSSTIEKLKKPTYGLISQDVVCATSTPACKAPSCVLQEILFTPTGQERNSMSPITKSTHHMCRAMQETMMTPRSRKPVLVTSGTNLHKLRKLQNQDQIMSSLTEEKSNRNVEIPVNSTPGTYKLRKSISENNLLPKIHAKNVDVNDDSYDSLTSPFRDYLHSRSIMTTSPVDLSFLSRTDDYSSTDVKDFSPTDVSNSLLNCLDGNFAENDGENEEVSDEEKELILKPRQFDENGLPIVFETSF